MRSPPRVLKCEALAASDMTKLSIQIKGFTIPRIWFYRINLEILTDINSIRDSTYRMPNPLGTFDGFIALVTVYDFEAHSLGIMLPGICNPA
jgi:hypothetical protein